MYVSDVARVPGNLRDAVDRFEASTAARRFFGDLVVDHYTHHLRAEIGAHQAAVSDWEMGVISSASELGEPVIVAGGGIGGLTTALTLHEIGVPVRVFESAMTIRPLGVGINLQPNAVRELTDLGLADRLPDIGVEAEEWALVGRNGNDVWAEPRGRRAGYRWPQFAVHRGELQMLLLDTVRERCGSNSVIEAHRLRSYEQTAHSVTATFEDRGTGRTVTVEGPFWSLRTGCTPPPAASASPTKVHRSGEEPCCGEARRWAGRSHRRIVHARRKPSSNASSTTRSAPSILHRTPAAELHCRTHLRPCPGLGCCELEQP